MSDRTGKWIFWTGTLTSLVLFLVLTADTHSRFRGSTHPERLDDQVLAGKHAFEHYNCNDCHTILGFGSYYAPDLTRAYTRIGDAEIRRILLSPEIVYATSIRKMPRQGVTPDQATQMIAYLRWVSDIDNHDWPPQDSRLRLARITPEAATAASVMDTSMVSLLQNENCLDCHMLGNQGTPSGPRLDWIGGRRDAGWIARFLENPDALAPGGQMPAYGQLTFEQRMRIGDFLVALAHQRRR